MAAFKKSVDLINIESGFGIFSVILKQKVANGISAFRETWLKILLHELHQSYENKTFKLENCPMLTMILNNSLTFQTTRILRVLLKEKCRTIMYNASRNILENQQCTVVDLNAKTLVNSQVREAE